MRKSLNKKIQSKKTSTRNKKMTAETSTRALRVMVKISDDNIFIRSSGVLSRNNQDGTVAIIRADSDKNFYTLDGIAANLWLLLNGKNSLHKIKATLCKKHRADFSTLSADSDRLLKKLIALSLVKLKQT